MSNNWQPSSQRRPCSLGYGSVSRRTRHHGQAIRTTIRKSRCHHGASPRHLKAIATEEERTDEHSRSVNCHVSANPQTTPSSGNSFTTTSGSNIPNGSSQMASPPCVILTRRASWNCSTLPRDRGSTNEVQNQKFRTWRKRSALDIVYYRLRSARQNSV